MHPFYRDAIAVVYPDHRRLMIIKASNAFSVAEHLHAKSRHVSLSFQSRKAPRLRQACAPGDHIFGARILTRGDVAVAGKQGLKERTVVVEYPSLEKATGAYDSAAYAEALKALGDGAVRDFRMVEGVE